MDGIILINKEKNYTSHDVVNIIRKLLKEKVGHTGTLDPNATGVLPLLIGNGTKFSKYLINHDKEYIATIKLGKRTETGDIEGDVLEEKSVKKDIYKDDNKKILEVLKSFIGNQKQIPPIYSAIKINGKKLYEYAREKRKIDIKSRDIEIYNIELLEVNEIIDEIIFRVCCSKGTYIRVLCEDIAKKLGTVGFMKDLKRTKVGDFEIKDSVMIEDFKKQKKYKILSLEEIANDYLKFDRIDLKENEYERYINGVNLETNEEDNYYRIYKNNIFIGIGIVKNNKLKRDIVI